MTGRFRTLAHTATPLISDADRQFIEALGPAIRRQLWLRFSAPDRDDKGMVIQLDSLPPQAPPGAADALAMVMTATAEQGGYETVSPAFERRGGADPTPRDHAWMSAVQAAAARAQLEIGLVMIRHSRGVRAYAQPIDG